MTPYTLSTGFFGDRAKLAGMNIWLQCLRHNIQQAPEAILVAAVGMQWGEWFHLDRQMPWPKPQAINLRGNLGHVGDLMNGSKKHQFTGWAIGFLTLSLQAYMNETDLLFVEQDAIVKGDVHAQALEDLGDGDWIFGGKMNSEPWMPCAQSLVYVRHQFIPEMVSRYLALGSDGETDNLTEHKFCKIEESIEPTRTKKFSFGFDREKPDFNQPIWYVQHTSKEDRDEAIRRSLT
jgi:hypothetical protein